MADQNHVCLTDAEIESLLDRRGKSLGSLQDTIATFNGCEKCRDHYLHRRVQKHLDSLGNSSDSPEEES